MKTSLVSLALLASISAAVGVELTVCDRLLNEENDITVKSASVVGVDEWAVEVSLGKLTEGHKVVAQLRAIDVTIDEQSGASGDRILLKGNGMIPRNVDVTMRVRTYNKAGNVTGCAKFDVDEAGHALLGAVRGIFTPAQTSYFFESWKKEFKMSFGTQEEGRRRDVFAANLRNISMHNMDSTQTFKKAMNQFGHLTGAEFKAMLGTRPYTSPKTSSTFSYKGKREDLSDTVDWVSKGAVTPVKNQGQCGSCWTFSTTGALEGARYIKEGVLTSLSEQNIVSCDTGGSGCSGGSMAQAFDWVNQNGGICTEEAYPYVSASGTAPSCSAGPSCTKENVRPTSHTSVESNEQSFMAAVAQQPVSIAVEADQSAFQFFKTGVITGTCGTKLDHGILLVGYGSNDGIDYWKVKNSWADTWGIEGYGRIERGAAQSGGECGILMGGVYPNL